ncbi:MAG TPA: glycosyltransferase family 39 protein [Blastocatellia bacterium]|nr:glycosyltransferase family 39 protein [Blastocatellia bacterium]
MKTIAPPAPANRPRASRAESLKDAAALVGVLAATALVYGALFNRESVLSYSIGYNLYSAGRVLAGEVPYRDFHTLYPPATVYLNAALFKWLGVSLYNALLGVFVFKTLTVLFIYLSGREVLSRGWAMAAALLSLVWLRPNGPFKAVPMHYGALFLALALWLLLKHCRTPRPALLFAAGCALGVLATFKHNIGAYALAGSLIVALLDNQEPSLRPSAMARRYRRGAILLAGFALPVAPVLIYMKSQSALGAMTRALLFGPGEFLLNRLAAVPSPDVPLIYAAAAAAVLFVAARLRANRANPRIAEAIVGAVIAGSLAFVALGPQSAVDKLIFYLPVFVIVAALAVFFFVEGMGAGERRALLAVTVAAAAAFMEAFPRFAREQAIAAMPFVALLIIVLLRWLLPAARRRTAMARPLAVALLFLPVAFGLMGSRLLFNTAFEGGLRFRSDTELTIERGRGVYFPPAQAREIESVVSYLQQRVPPDGYFFPQSYAGSSYLFLADRHNPSGAQFWGGVGVSPAERAHTLDALESERVNLILTSEKDMAAERYAPLRDYIERNFHAAASFGEVVILERGAAAQ